MPGVHLSSILISAQMSKGSEVAVDKCLSIIWGPRGRMIIEAVDGTGTRGIEFPLTSSRIEDFLADSELAEPKIIAGRSTLLSGR